MNDAQSTVVGLKAQECPGGGWTGQPAELERATVADCLAHGVCGCIYGDAVQHIERMRSAWMFRLQLENECQGALHSRGKPCQAKCGCDMEMQTYIADERS